MYYHIIREEPMWISVFIFCILFPNFDFQYKMIHLFVMRFFQRKKSFYIIRLFSNIWGHYLTFFSSNSKLLFFLDYYYTQELHVFLKILLFLFFQLMIVVEIGLGMYYPNTQNPNLTRIWVDEYANSTWTRLLGLFCNPKTRNSGKTRL